MKAMILAAGKGERMRPLTETTPKPLLSVGGKPLIQYHVENLVAAGFRELVVNVSWLGEQIVDFLEARDWGCDIAISAEQEPLETAGGIIRALPLLGAGPFALVNGDVWCDFDLPRLRTLAGIAAGHGHLVLVDNPPHHASGDFYLDDHGRVHRQASPGQARVTYAGIAVFDSAFFTGYPDGGRPLLPLLEAAIAEGRLAGEHHPGQWEDVGTPERLRLLDERLSIH